MVLMRKAIALLFATLPFVILALMIITKGWLS